MQPLEARITQLDWVRYGHTDNIEAATFKLNEEAGELNRGVRKREHENITEEIADVFLALCRVARLNGVSVLAAVETKLVRLEDRWRKERKRRSEATAPSPQLS